jgi:hypothetical protein
MHICGYRAYRGGGVNHILKRNKAQRWSDMNGLLDYTVDMFQ